MDMPLPATKLRRHVRLVLATTPSVAVAPPVCPRGLLLRSVRNLPPTSDNAGTVRLRAPGTDLRPFVHERHGHRSPTVPARATDKAHWSNRTTQSGRSIGPEHGPGTEFL